MIEVYQRLFVGDDSDAKNIILRNEPNWAILHCCKEPWHREMLGYVGRAAPKNHPEYLYALRGSRLALNMVDTYDSKYFSVEMIRAGIAFMNYMYKMEYSILCHCNEGKSRGPSVAMLFMASKLKVLPDNYNDAEAEFAKLYPYYAPMNGIQEHLMDNWPEYMKEKATNKPIQAQNGHISGLWGILNN